MKKIGFVFSSSPHCDAQGREGLDAILATSAYSEHISLFFVGQGVTQLIRSQQPDAILSRDYISAFKLLELYDIEQVYVCQQSLERTGFDAGDLLIDAQVTDSQALSAELMACDVLLRF